MSDSFLSAARRLLKSWRHAKRGDSSFAGEHAYLRALLSRLDIRDGHIVDMAASDGVTQSCTLGFFQTQDWPGLAVEMDPAKFATLAFIYARFPNVRLARCRITPLNVAPLLTANEVSQSDWTLLNLDLDSYDLAVIDAILSADYRPRVISMEINEKLPPPLYFAVSYDAQHRWNGDHFYGCSLAAAAAVVRPYGYLLESLQFNNAVFVRADYAARGIEDRPVELAYAMGYRDRAERRRLFAWNANVEVAFTSSPEANVDFFNRLFARYRGRYVLTAAAPAGHAQARAWAHGQGLSHTLP